MNREPQSWDAVELDRLVDGELQGAEYQDLLRRLDRSPEGWKQCALAFLEAQALRQDLAGLAREEAVRTPSAAPPDDARWPSWVWPLAVAASLLGMLFLQQPGLRDPAANLPPAAAPRPLEAAAGKAPTTLAGQQPPAGRLLLPVVEDANRPGRELNIPFYSPDSYPAEEPWQMSERTQRLIQERGGAVGTERIWQQVPLEDGGSVLVPIDRYYVKPAPSY